MSFILNWEREIDGILVLRIKGMMELIYKSCDVLS